MKLVLSVLASAGIAVVLYILLHELGHGIVMLSAGATITDFSILTAHITAAGGVYTDLSAMWLNANGAVLPILAAYLYLVCYNPNREGTFYRVFSYMVALVPTASVIAWLTLPLSYLSGNAPARDDVTKFLDIFSRQHHPLLVSAAAAAIMAGSVALMVKKGVFRNFIGEVKKGAVKKAR